METTKQTNEKCHNCNSNIVLDFWGGKDWRKRCPNLRCQFNVNPQIVRIDDEPRYVGSTFLAQEFKGINYGK